ncbi:hypothetical protein E4417_16815 [Stenotrophomonas maltophilia]|uniref:hypothetical protein n=1 Tax=Stenotrophomonas maltophilia TaxID=40324 RepID=UPI001094D6A0|nr:hypothetical protein [Stenotrophomonas maltophilia]TGW16886.1 hypothetical protein E4417_16815 [Stenotrophomonas maltophilia]
MNDFNKACTCPSGDGSLRHPCPAHPALADVQPGGRVRLGDQAERARFEAYFNAFNLDKDADGSYLREMIQDKWEDWQVAWRAALSAQPSPGGQRDVVAATVWEALQEAGYLFSAGPFAEAHPDDQEKCRRIVAAIAASQPQITLLPDDRRIVEKVAAEIERGKLDHPGFYRNTQLAEALRRVLDAALAARQPVAGLSWADYWIERGQPDVAHDFDAFSRAEAWALQRFPYAGQPVGQPTDAEIDARLNTLYRDMVASGQHNGGMSGAAWDRAVYRMASNQSPGNSGELAVDIQPAGVCAACLDVGPAYERERDAGATHEQALNAVVADAIAARWLVGQEPVEYQIRQDLKHNGFNDDHWQTVSRQEYEENKRVMGGHGPRRLSGSTGRGDLRIDESGWMIELRELFDAPPAQALNLEQFRPLTRYVIEQAAGTRGDMHMLACQLKTLIDREADGYAH